MPDNAKKTYRRRIIIINKPFQVRFAFYVTTWIFALSIFYPLVIFNLYNTFAKYMSLDPAGPSAQVIAQTRNDVLLLLIGFSVLFVVITLVLSLYLSHRIAGPLYKLKKAMLDSTTGPLVNKIQFRDEDHFKDLAQSYNLLMDKVNSMLQEKSKKD